MHGSVAGPFVPNVLAPQASPPSALGTLREATHAAHEALEAQLPLLGPHLSMGMVTQYLEAILPVVQTAEAIAGHSGPALFEQQYDYAIRRRTSLLVADLGRLAERRPVKFPKAAAPKEKGRLTHELLHFDDDIGRLGIIYVLEGSTLGGLKLCQHLLAHLPLKKEDLQYLRGHEANTGLRWRQTCRMLERNLACAQAQQWAGQAARATFRAFSGAIARMGQPS